MKRAGVKVGVGTRFLALLAARSFPLINSHRVSLSLPTMDVWRRHSAAGRTLRYRWLVSWSVGPYSAELNVHSSGLFRVTFSGPGQTPFPQGS
jgi:hypothetical protein